MTTGYDGRGARFDVVAAAGTDLSFTVTAVDGNSDPVDVSAATITAAVYNGAGTVLDTMTSAVGGGGSNVITLSFTDTEVDALTSPASWGLIVERSGDARVWLAGRFQKVGSDDARPGTSGTAVTATVDTGVSVTADVLTASQFGNVDGGRADTNYTSTTSVDGGSA